MDGGAKTRKDRGHLMVALVVFVAMLAIGTLKVGQAWTDFYQREMEAEMMFRAQEIARAIFRYRQDRSAQPLTDLKLLLEPGSKGQYFIRQLYEDPLVKDGKWGLLYQGPNNSIIDPNAPDMGQFVLGDEIPSESIGSQGGFGQQGTQQIGGLPIIGVKSLCKDPPFRIWKDQSDYAEWKFTIFDVMNQNQRAVPGQQQQQQQQRPGGPGGQPLR